MRLTPRAAQEPIQRPNPFGPVRTLTVSAQSAGGTYEYAGEACYEQTGADCARCKNLRAQGVIDSNHTRGGRSAGTNRMVSLPARRPNEPLK